MRGTLATVIVKIVEIVIVKVAESVLDVKKETTIITTADLSV